MQINTNYSLNRTQQNRQNFGMAVHRDTVKIAEMFDFTTSLEVEKAMLRLDSIGKHCEVYVTPVGRFLKGFVVDVLPLGATRDRLTQLLGNLPSKRIFPTDDFEDRLVQVATEKAERYIPRTKASS